MLGDRLSDIQQKLDQLSDIQREIYECIRQYIRDNDMAPTNREIRDALRIASISNVNYHLGKLQDKGLIDCAPNIARGIKLVKPRGIPVEGTIAAGRPLIIFKEPEQMIDLGYQLEHQDIYALRVEGNSMIEDYICDGDFVAVRRQTIYVNGDIVVAVNLPPGGESSATLKGFHREKDGICLQPANEDLDSFFIPKEEWDQEWQIQGKVVAILRRDPISRYRLPKGKNIMTTKKESSSSI